MMKTAQIPANQTAPDGRQFSMAGYGAFLDAFRDAGYAFVPFDDTPAQKNTVIIRHDIDFDLAHALAVAKMEHARGVAATYFIMLRSEMYNVFSTLGSQHIRDIQALGHTIGLHFDASAYPDAGADELREAVHREMQTLENWFGWPMKSMSFHRPRPQHLEDGAGALTAPYLHSYQTCFMKDRTYFSDAQGLWRFGHPFDSEAFKSGAPFQVLVHPIWWTQEPAGDPYDTLLNFLDRRSATLAHQTALHCKTFRRGVFADIKD